MCTDGESRDVFDITDRNYNVLWYAEQCLLRLQNHLAAADGEPDGPRLRRLK